MKNIKKMLVGILILTALTGCSFEKHNNAEKTKEKVKEETAYIDKKIVDIENNLNDILLQNYKINSKEVELSQETEIEDSISGEKKNTETEQDTSKQGEQDNMETQDKKTKKVKMSKMVSGNILESNFEDINWSKIKTDIELINIAWSIILVDLYQLNLPEEVANEFSNQLNNCIISISNEDKNTSIENLALLYNILPTILDKIEMNKKIITIKTVKGHLLSAYSFANKREWQNVKDELYKMERKFVNLQKDKTCAKNKINNITIDIQEIKQCLNNENLKIFLMNYKKLIERINIL